MNEGKNWLKHQIKNSKISLNSKIKPYVATKIKHLAKLIKNQNNIITSSQMFDLLYNADNINYLIFEKFLRNSNEGHPPFIQSTSEDLYRDAGDKSLIDTDITLRGFLTDADIANDLNISYTKAKRMLSPKYHSKTMPKIHNTVKLWHVKDDMHKHFHFIKNKKKRRDKYHKYSPVTKGYICGKNKPKIVVGVNTYLEFIEDYYDPKHTQVSQRKHILSDYANDTFRKYHQMRYTNYELMIKLTRERKKIFFYKEAFYHMKNKDDVNNFIDELFNIKDKLLNSSIPTKFTKPRYPEYQSQSRLLNKINKANYPNGNGMDYLKLF